MSPVAGSRPDHRGPSASLPTASSRPGPETSRAAPGAAGADLCARVAWSHLAEPTDAVAHYACRLLGHAGALELVREATVPEMLHALGVDLPADLADAVRRPSAPSGARGAAGEGLWPAGAERLAARGGLGSGQGGPETSGRGPTGPVGNGPGQGSGAARASAALGRWRARLDGLDVDRVLDAAQARGIRAVVPGDADWPSVLDDLADTAPHCLWVSGAGSPAALVDAVPTIAMVGSRASTPYGEDTAASLAAALAVRGATIVSGGAYGIDAAAHRGALASGEGATLAVLAGGLDALYPRGNSRLLEAIRSRHALISEAPPATAPTRWRFLARNRLIAALGSATVVVEAAWRSGALSTARHADDLSRPVAAVPGPVTSAASAGCHRLIRERGAVLVTDAAEILELVRGQEAADGSVFAVQDELDLLDPVDRRVLDALPPRSAITPADLERLCALPGGAVEAAVARLELLGLARHAGERIARAR